MLYLRIYFWTLIYHENYLVIKDNNINEERKYIFGKETFILINRKKNH